MNRVKSCMSAVLCILAALCLATTLLLTSVQVFAFQTGYYEKAYARYGVAETIGASDEDLMQITQNLLDYLKGSRRNLDMQAQIGMKGDETEVFTETEKAHMVDVRWMFRTGFIVRDASLGLFAVCLAGAWLLRRDGFAKRCAICTLGTLGTVVAGLCVLALWISTDFNATFVRLHEMTFTNDLWLLDPDVHVLINLVPEQFFAGIARDIALTFAACIVLAAVICIVVLLRGRAAARKAVEDAVQQ